MAAGSPVQGGAVHPGGRGILPGRTVNPVQNHLVRIGKGRGKFLQQGGGAGIGVGHKVHHQLAAGIKFTVARQRGPDGRGMVGVVVQNHQLVPPPNQLAAPFSPTEGGKSAGKAFCKPDRLGFGASPRLPQQLHRQGDGSGGVQHQVTARHLKVEGMAPKARKIEALPPLLHLTEPNPVVPPGSLAVGNKLDVRPLACHNGGSLCSSCIVSAINQLAPLWQEAGIVNKGGQNSLVGGEIVLVVALHAGEDDFPGVEVHEVPLVLAGLRHKEFLAQAQGAAALPRTAKAGDEAARQHLHRQAELGKDGSRKARGGGLAVDSRNAAAVGVGRKLSQSLGIEQAGNPTAAGLLQLAVGGLVVGGGMDDTEEVASDVGSIEAASRDSTGSQHLVGIEGVRHVAPGNAGTPLAENLGQGGHPRPLDSHKMNVKPPQVRGQQEVFHRLQYSRCKLIVKGGGKARSLLSVNRRYICTPTNATVCCEVLEEKSVVFNEVQ